MAADSVTSGGSRHSILDLAPLELDCMNALWPSGEATVRQIQEALRPTRPRAYTTIMTILDRLTQKGIVERRKSGRAWVYRANVSADEARSHAVSQVVEGFFGGSAGALATHLSGRQQSGQLDAPWPVRLVVPASRPPDFDSGAAVARRPAAGKRRVREDAGDEASASPKTNVPASLDPALL